MKNCTYCNRMVNPEKQVNWFWLFALTILTAGSWLFFYIPYYLFFKTKRCPICKGDI